MHKNKKQHTPLLNSGEYDEIEHLYNSYSTDVYRYLLSLCRNPDLAADLMQTTFLQVMKGILGFRNDCSVKTWIFTIARNEYLRWLKKYPATEPLDDKLYITPDFTAAVIAKDQANKILAYIKQLAEPYQSLLIFRLVGELSYREIGLILGKTETWSRVTFLRYKRKLLEELKEELE